MSKYRVVYYSLYLPRTEMIEDVFSEKYSYDRRIERIKRYCHCDIRGYGSEALTSRGDGFILVEFIYDRHLGNHVGCMYMFQNLFKSLRPFVSNSFKIIPHRCILRDRRGLYHTVGFQGQKGQAILKALALLTSKNAVDNSELTFVLQNTPEIQSLASLKSIYPDFMQRRIRTKSVCQPANESFSDETALSKKSDYFFGSDALELSENHSFDRTSFACDSTAFFQNSISLSECKMQSGNNTRSIRKRNIYCMKGFKRNQNLVKKSVSIASLRYTINVSPPSSHTPNRGDTIRNKTFAASKKKSVNNKLIHFDKKSTRQCLPNPNNSKSHICPKKTKKLAKRKSVKLNRSDSNPNQQNEGRKCLAAKSKKKHGPVRSNQTSASNFFKVDTIGNPNIRFVEASISSNLSFSVDRCKNDNDRVQNYGGEVFYSCHDGEIFKYLSTRIGDDECERLNAFFKKREKEIVKREIQDRGNIKFISDNSEGETDRFLTQCRAKETKRVKMEINRNESERILNEIMKDLCKEEAAGFIEGHKIFFFPKKAGHFRNVSKDVKIYDSACSKSFDDGTFFKKFTSSNYLSLDLKKQKNKEEDLSNAVVIGEIMNITDDLINEICKENAYSMLLAFTRFFKRCKDILPDVPDTTLIKEMFLIMDEESKLESKLLLPPTSRSTSPSKSPTRLMTNKLADKMGSLKTIEQAISTLEPVVFDGLYDELVNAAFVTSQDVIQLKLLYDTEKVLLEDVYSYILDVEVDRRTKSDIIEMKMIELVVCKVESNLLDWLIDRVLDNLFKQLLSEKILSEKFKWIYNNLDDAATESKRKKENYDQRSHELIDEVVANVESRLGNFIYNCVVEYFTDDLSNTVISPNDAAVIKVQSLLVDFLYDTVIDYVADRIYSQNSNSISKALKEIEIDLWNWIFDERSGIRQSILCGNDMKHAKLITCAIKMVELELVDLLIKNIIDTVVTEKEVGEQSISSPTRKVNIQSIAVSSKTSVNIFSDLVNRNCIEDGSVFKESHNQMDNDDNSDPHGTLQQKHRRSSIEEAQIEKPMIMTSSRKSSIDDAGKMCSRMLRRSKILKEIYSEMLETSMINIERKIIEEEIASKRNTVSKSRPPTPSPKKTGKVNNVSHETTCLSSTTTADTCEMNLDVIGTPLFESREISEGVMRYVTISAVRKIVTEVISCDEGIHDHHLRRSRHFIDIFGDASLRNAQPHDAKSIDSEDASMLDEKRKCEILK